MKAECAGCGEDCSNAYATWNGEPYHIMCLPAPKRKAVVDPAREERIRRAALKAQGDVK